MLSQFSAMPKKTYLTFGSVEKDKAPKKVSTADLQRQLPALRLFECVRQGKKETREDFLKRLRIDMNN
jgi:hypothetical protein